MVSFEYHCVRILSTELDHIFIHFKVDKTKQREDLAEVVNQNKINMAFVGLALVAFGLLLFSGCGNSQNSGGAPVLGGPAGPSGLGGPDLSGRSGVQPNILDTVKDAITGDKKGRIDTAEDLLIANVNPFLNKIPVEQVVAPDGTVEDTGPEIDPFEGLNLVGIVYNQDKPMALLSVADSTQTQMVQVGATVDGTVGITSIGQDHVKLKQVDSGESLTLYLPDIIGYQGGAGSSEPSADFDAGGRQRGDSVADKAMDKVGDIIKGLQDI